MGELPEVRALLPHRPPMLMVDRVAELREDGCTALKNISWSEPCFQGHFPDNPIFPGVLIIEALAQTCAIWLSQQHSGALPIFAGIESARFRRSVSPGDQLKLDVQLSSQRKGFYTFQTAAEVSGELACEAVLTVCLRTA